MHGCNTLKLLSASLALQASATHCIDMSLDLDTGIWPLQDSISSHNPGLAILLRNANIGCMQTIQTPPIQYAIDRLGELDRQ